MVLSKYTFVVKRKKKRFLLSNHFWVRVSQPTIPACPNSPATSHPVAGLIEANGRIYRRAKHMRPYPASVFECSSLSWRRRRIHSCLQNSYPTAGPRWMGVSSVDSRTERLTYLWHFELEGEENILYEWTTNPSSRWKRLDWTWTVTITAAYVSGIAYYTAAK